MQPKTQAMLNGHVIAIPFVGVAYAGFPSPATDYLESGVSLDKMLIKHPSSTYLCRVSGDRLADIGIGDGDLAVVDKSLSVAQGKVAVISYRGELVLAKIVVYKGKLWFHSANPLHPPLDAWHDDDRLILWGIITHVIKKML